MIIAVTLSPRVNLAYHYVMPSFLVVQQDTWLIDLLNCEFVNKQSHWLMQQLKNQCFIRSSFQSWLLT